jgi:hypothetical protein
MKSIRNIDDANRMLIISDRIVSQKNYTYLLWGVLAVGILTLTIKSMKK